MKRRVRFGVFAVLIIQGLFVWWHLGRQQGPRAAAGVLDLSDRAWISAPVRLAGEFDYAPLAAPLRHPTPTDSIDRGKRKPHNLIRDWRLLTVPGPWNDIRAGTASGLGRGIYRLKIISPEAGERREIVPAVSINGLTPFVANVVVNGFPLRYGRPGADGHPGIGTEIHRIPPHLARADTLTLTVEVYNAFHRKGGLLADLYLGQDAQLRARRSLRLGQQAGIIAIFLAFGFFNLGLYFIFSRDRLFLAFGVFCLLATLRGGVTGEALYATLFPDLPHFLIQDFRYAGPVLATVAYGIFLQYLFQGAFGRWGIRVPVLAGAMVAALLVVTPTVTSTSFAWLIPVYTLSAAVLYIVVAFRVQHRFPMAVSVTLLAGGLALWCNVHDFALIYLRIPGSYWELYGLLAAVFGQGIVSLHRFRTIYRRNQSLNAELEATNAGLEQTVRERTEEITHQRDELLDLQRFRSRVNNMIVHDLKSPLQVIISRNQPDLGGDASTYAASRRMLMMVQNILDVERAESAKLELRPESIRLCDLVRGSRQRMEQFASENNVSLLEDCSFDHVIRVDRILTERCLDNLIHNAIKFSTAGSSVEIIAFEQPTVLQLDVIDFGAGVPEDVLPGLFDDFNTQSAAGRGSHGLGLSFVRLAMQEMGGEVTYMRQQDRSRFSLTFPKPATPVLPVTPVLSPILLRSIQQELKELAKLPLYKITAINEVLQRITQSDDDPQLAAFCKQVATLALAGDEAGYRTAVNHIEDEDE